MRVITLFTLVLVSGCNTQTDAGEPPAVKSSTATRAVSDAEAFPPSIPEAVVAHVRTSRSNALGIKRYAIRDLGPYEAFRLKFHSDGPGDPGHALLYAKDGQPMLDEQSDWTGFLVAAEPHKVAKALAAPLDRVLNPSEAAAKPYDSLHKLPEAVRAQLKDPRISDDGTLEFFVIDGVGDPPSDFVFRVVATAKNGGGINITRERLAL